MSLKKKTVKNLMRRFEKNTNKRKGAFLQSLSSVGDVNTFQKPRKNSYPNKSRSYWFLQPCYQVWNALPTCTGWVLASFLQKTLFALEKSLNFLASVSAASASKEVDGGKAKRVSSRKAPLNSLTGKPCAGTLSKKEQCEK